MHRVSLPLPSRASAENIYFVKCLTASCCTGAARHGYVSSSARLSIRLRPAALELLSPHSNVSPPVWQEAAAALHADRRSRGGPRVSGRGQVQQGADGPGHLGEPSLLQDVQRKTQLTLDRRTPQRETHGGGTKANTTERRVNGWQLKTKGQHKSNHDNNNWKNKIKWWRKKKVRNRTLACSANQLARLWVLILG